MCTCAGTTCFVAGKEKNMDVTTLCYLEKDGKYLMLHRTKKENDVNEGKWIAVGGHCENAESPEDCGR